MVDSPIISNGMMGILFVPNGMETPMFITIISFFIFGSLSFIYFLVLSNQPRFPAACTRKPPLPYTLLFLFLSILNFLSYTRHPSHCYIVYPIQSAGVTLFINIV